MEASSINRLDMSSRIAPTLPAAGAMAPSEPGFAGLLAGHRSASGPTDLPRARSTPPNHRESHEAAQQLVSIALVQPVLAQMRRDPFRTEMFHGGFAEDAFGARLDSILAERITQRSNLPLVDAIERTLGRHSLERSRDPHASSAKVNLRG